MPHSQVPAVRTTPAGERRSSPRRAAFEASLAECRAHLGRALSADGDHLTISSADGVRRAVGLLAQSAAAHQVPPQRAIAAFKRMVTLLPPVAARPGDVRGSIVGVLTQVLIDAYYRPDGDGKALLRNDGPQF